MIDVCSDNTSHAPFKCERKFALPMPEQQNNGVNVNWNRLQDLAEAEIEATLAALPKPLREQAKRLPVTFENVPNAGLQADGIEPDTLGLFTGSEFADEGASVLPPQIILFLQNLWDFVNGDEETFCEEVHTTYLHELGHFFGLDEDDLTARGLE
jgi:predicted Zn-dependent protease with MMP-like domain